ncbi:MAG: tRNA-(ms[2]io[6]A)-hydroxylase [Planctomycetota bacterium]|nr:MAG: tRNA-(ms[2]io[6]A)-hydroxylase [Planctomycetota bacterium]
MVQLSYKTPREWATKALENFDELLRDHAFCERKAHATAMKFIAQYPDRDELVSEMLELATEELLHFRQCYGLMRTRGVPLGKDAPDPYVQALRSQLKGGDADDVLLERLLLAGVIEARSCERMGLISEALEDEKLRGFYRRLCQAEARHELMFEELAELYFDKERVSARLSEMLEHEAKVIAELPWRHSLH